MRWIDELFEWAGLGARQDGEGETGRQGTVSGAKPRTVSARILWPALGFPAVVTPSQKPSASPFAGGDATRCICILLLSDKATLTREDVARYLRYVPWRQRGRRHIAAGQPGSFRPLEVAVLNGVQPLARPKAGEVIAFGGGQKTGAYPLGINGVVCHLSKDVRSFYRQHGLEHLHELRIYETALARLKEPLYHLFWNNESKEENAPSSEMRLLLDKHARPTRMQLGNQWITSSRCLMEEYEYEYRHGEMQVPCKPASKGKRVRSEILHPLFIERKRSTVLRVGQITDTHVDVRADVYEENLKQEGIRVPYNNWNTSFEKIYDHARKDSDVVLLTGDLIDYGRGHVGVSARTQLGDDSLYHVDRNWFLFYHLLAKGKAYSRPVYTILGNHDWRLNPYTPFAIAGAPSPQALLHNWPPSKPGKSKATLDQESEQRKAVLRKAHGKGHERIISYVHDIETRVDLLRRRYLTDTIGQLIKIVFGGKQTADIPKYPTETTVESVKWYLLAINPFLDYSFAHPYGQKLLMLDWAEDENVFFPQISNGRRKGLNIAWIFGGDPGGEGPKARNCLTEVQKDLTEKFLAVPARAKIIGIHAPPIAPWSDWYDDELNRGMKTYTEDETPRGSLGFATKTSGFPRALKAHPFFAIRPPMQVSSDPIWGMDANYNSFEQHRTWFINEVSKPEKGVRLVLAGHIHRNGLFATYIAGKHRGSALAGQRFIHPVAPAAAAGVKAPRVSNTPHERTSAGVAYPTGPLYVNTTSAGPRGHYYASRTDQRYVDPGYAHVELVGDGTIKQVQFRFVGPTAATMPAATVAPARPAPRPVTPPSMKTVKPAPARAPAGAKR
jgi:3',5'-cyclic AMP phosphodiesterase CpdA